MSHFTYIDDIWRTPAIAHSHTLVLAAEFRDKPDDALINIQLSNGRCGKATAESLKQALDMSGYTIIAASPGWLMHYISKADQHTARIVGAWSVQKDRWGAGAYTQPVPDRLPDLGSFGFGSPFVCVQRPDKSIYTSTQEFTSLEVWREYASRELKAWHKKASE